MLPLYGSSLSTLGAGERETIGAAKTGD